MKYSFDKHKPLCRFFICLVCALTLVGLFCRPITASASAAVAAVEVGLSSGAAATVLPEIALIMLLLLGAGYVIDSIEDLINDAQTLYNENGYVQRWSYTYASAGIGSLTQVYYDEETRLAVNEYIGGNLPGLPPDDDDRKYFLAMPATFMMLDTLQTGSLIMYDKATLAAVLDNKALIMANNALAVETNSAVLGMQGSMAELVLIVGGASAVLKTMSNKLQEQLSASNRWFQIINNNMMDYTNKVKSEVYWLREYLVGRLDTMYNFLVNRMDRGLELSHAINQNLMRYTNMINSSITNLRTSLVTYQSGIHTYTFTMKNTLSKLSDQLAVSVPGIVPSFAPAIDNAQLWQEVVGNQNDDGKKSIPIWLDLGNDVLTDYATPVLASTSVLSKFFAIPLISDLVHFSLALGIFALLVNLGNTIVSKNGENTVKGKRAKTLKGG